MSDLVRIIETSGLPIAKADALLKAFSPLVEEAGTLCAVAETVNVTDATQVSEIKRARETRLALKKVRVSAEAARKELKADILAAGKAIDGANKWLVDRIVPAEERMEHAEKFAERVEAERIARLKSARETLLAPFGIDTSFYSLGAMPEATFAQLLDSTRTAHEAKIAAERKAEEERLAAIEAKRIEDERIRAENARLAEEKRQLEEQARRERELAETERRAAEVKAKAERDAIEAEARKEREKIEAANRAEREKTEAAAKAERERAAEELRKANEAREAAERKIREEKESADRKAKAEAAAAKKAAAAPDKEKILRFATVIRNTELPKCKTPEGDAIVTRIRAYIGELANKIEQAGQQL